MNQQIIKGTIIRLLKGGNAHADIDDILKNIPIADLGKYPHNLPYSIWDLLSHMRIAQSDILAFCQNPDYRSLNWPDGYWVKKGYQPSAEEWAEVLATFKKDRQAFISLLEDSEDVLEPFDWGEGQHLLQEALTIADHDAYHWGEILVLRRLLGNWNN